MIKSVADQIGNNITISFPPSRIISLVPSQTELLADLGLDKEVIGITKFCIHPEQWLKEKAVIGGTKKFNLEKIAALKPDLILGNKEENYKEGIEALRRDYPVWVSDITSLQDACAMINAVGDMTGKGNQAAAIVESITKAFTDLTSSLSSASVLYLIWRKPWMGAGVNTFINTMLESAGFRNCLANVVRYPELTEEQIASLQPDLIFLSSEPYPFKEEHMPALQELCPASHIMLVDGEMFSWYGSRLMQAPGYFTKIRAMIN